jgi:hypothetical protein
MKGRNQVNHTTRAQNKNSNMVFTVDCGEIIWEEWTSMTGRYSSIGLQTTKRTSCRRSSRFSGRVKKTKYFVIGGLVVNAYLEPVVSLTPR